MMTDGIGGAAGGIASSAATGQDEYRLPTDIQPTVRPPLLPWKKHNQPSRCADPLALRFGIQDGSSVTPVRR